MEIPAEALTDTARYIESNREQFALREQQIDGILSYLTLFRPIDSSLKMLEVGTGLGWFPIIARKRGLDLRGIEISAEFIGFAKELGRRHGVEPDIQLANIEKHDLGENIYDVIICSSVFEHVEDWRTGLRTVYRALKPGGLLFFESTNKFSITSGEYPLPCYGWMPDWMRYRFRIMKQGPDIMRLGIDFNQFTYPLLRREFRKIGFSEWRDRVYLSQPDNVKSPLKRNILKLCKSNAIIREITLTFFEATTFVCVK
jgi:SAM-dependent methyltransferase